MKVSYCLVTIKIIEVAYFFKNSFGINNVYKGVLKRKGQYFHTSVQLMLLELFSEVDIELRF